MEPGEKFHRLLDTYNIALTRNKICVYVCESAQFQVWQLATIRTVHTRARQARKWTHT